MDGSEVSPVMGPLIELPVCLPEAMLLASERKQVLLSGRKALPIEYEVGAIHRLICHESMRVEHVPGIVEIIEPSLIDQESFDHRRPNGS
jgi:hypothetical protein